MKYMHYAAVAAALTLTLGACERETTTTAVAPGAPGVAGAPATAASAPDEYNEAMEHLQRAAQQLREATQAMADEAPGPRRNDAIRQAHAALINANASMSQLYKPELGAPSPSAGTTFGGAGGIVGGTVYPQSDEDYTRAMEKLQQSAQQFREAIISMANLQPGPQRNEAIQTAQQALFDTNQAMIQLPSEMRTESR